MYCEFSGLITGPGPNTSGGCVEAEVCGLPVESVGISAAIAVDPKSNAISAMDN